MSTYLPNLEYWVSPKELKKIPVAQDTLNIVESLRESGKYTVPRFCEQEMYALFDQYNVFYTVRKVL